MGNPQLANMCGNEPEKAKKNKNKKPQKTDGKTVEEKYQCIFYKTIKNMAFHKEKDSTLKSGGQDHLL